MTARETKWFFRGLMLAFGIVCLCVVWQACAQEVKPVRCVVACTVDLERNVCSYDTEPVDGACVPCVDSESIRCEPRMKRI